MARRLVERGVPYITINYPGWDTHKDNFQIMRRKLPEMDKGMSSLLAGPCRPRAAAEHDRLVDRRIRPQAQGGLGSPLERRTQPLGQGLFGTSWPAADSRAARSSARPTPRARKCKDRPVYPCDVIGSMYELLGIDTEASLPHPLGLPTRVTPAPEDKVPSAGRLTEIMQS